MKHTTRSRTDAHDQLHTLIDLREAKHVSPFPAPAFGPSTCRQQSRAQKLFQAVMFGGHTDQSDTPVSAVRSVQACVCRCVCACLTCQVSDNTMLHYSEWTINSSGSRWAEPVGPHYCSALSNLDLRAMLSPEGHISVSLKFFNLTTQRGKTWQSDSCSLREFNVFISLRTRRTRSFLLRFCWNIYWRWSISETRQVKLTQCLDWGLNSKAISALD